MKGKLSFLNSLLKKGKKFKITKWKKNFFFSAYLDSLCLYIIVCENYVITFHPDHLSNISKIHKRFEKFEHIELSVGWILYAILDNVIGILLLKNGNQSNQ